MSKFRKKSLVIEACLWDGDFKDKPAWLDNLPLDLDTQNGVLIHTEEGTMTAKIGDWIIKGVKGEIYPCKPDIFEMTYEAVR